MIDNTTIVDLVANYGAYATVDELTMHSTVDAPATTVPCAVASSTYCAAGVGAAAGATYKIGC